MPTAPSSRSKKAARKKDVYTCQCCGLEKKATDFYLSSSSYVWKKSKGRVLFCKECVNDVLKELTPRYGERIALAYCCALVDLPYIKDLYNAIISKNQVLSFGMYARGLNGVQYKSVGKTFINSLVDDEINFDPVMIAREEEPEVEWTGEDNKNKSFVLSIVGYDPFESAELTDADYQYCINTLAAYCDSPDTAEDPHKIQSVIEMTMLNLQCRKVNGLINRELLSADPDESKIKNLSDTKSKFINALSKMAQDNNISSNNSTTSKAGKNALTEKMKVMYAEGYRPIEVSLFDVKTCDAMKQVADLSNRSIMDQLAFEDNDYADMIKEQREAMVDYQRQIAELTEANRKLQNQLLEYEQPEEDE